MARERKAGRRDAGELEGQPDPRAPLDGARFLAAARPVLARLAEDLLARVDASPAVAAAVAARHAAEVAARRTADPLAVWRASFVDQVAAAWLLSCVFARVLEDRGLVAAARLAGPGASDSQRLFFEVAPSLSERDYLLIVFRELARFPAARDLFDARHNPAWLLTPSAEAAKALLALFRLPSADAPAFRFGQADTRFLGDLYQDLNESVQKRYALLQTPRFVESFILDRTLDRAIDRFGLDDTTLIDPTCGSGHFLLGAFDRLFDRRLAAEPGLDPRQAAARALDAVYGADINPY
ncbi:MAG: SAM-dependent methyltransferase, partial [Deltaproteobacteria bacterium]